MKIRIIQHGFENFSGLLGDVRFESGVSVGEVGAQQADYVRAIFVTETFEAAEGDEAAAAAAAQAAEAERIAAEQAAAEAAKAERLAAEQAAADAAVEKPEDVATEQVSE